MLANPWVILAAVLAFAGITSGAYIKGRGDGADGVIARQARDDAVRMETLQLAQQGAAEAIAAQKVTHTTINRKAETVIREHKVYVECVNPDDIVRLLDDARAGRAPSEPAGGGVLPGPGPSPSP